MLLWGSPIDESKVTSMQSVFCILVSAEGGTEGGFGPVLEVEVVFSPALHVDRCDHFDSLLDSVDWSFHNC